MKGVTLHNSESTRRLHEIFLQYRSFTALLDDKCLGCLCHTLTGCNSTLKCQKGQCGVFKISWPYWADGEKPLVNEDDDPDSAEAFENCGIDRKCSERAVQGYMTKYRQVNDIQKLRLKFLIMYVFYRTVTETI
jgi:hypothetical protein